MVLCVLSAACEFTAPSPTPHPAHHPSPDESQGGLSNQIDSEAISARSASLELSPPATRILKPSLHFCQRRPVRQEQKARDFPSPAPCPDRAAAVSARHVHYLVEHVNTGMGLQQDPCDGSVSLLSCHQQRGPAILEKESREEADFREIQPALSDRNACSQSGVEERCQIRNPNRNAVHPPRKHGPGSASSHSTFTTIAGETPFNSSRCYIVDLSSDVVAN